MKYCPSCERGYADERTVCPTDGVALRQSRPGADPFIGHTINGQYRVLRKLGGGPTGIVYMAEQLSVFRTVALKVLHREFVTNPQFERRFRREASVAALLGHRNVITVYDFDKTEDGSLYIAMEYIVGKTLMEIMKEGIMAVGRAVNLATQAARGLGSAHAAGVIHRNVKPENVMVMAESDEVKVIDFGIARVLGHVTPAGAGVIIGTPAYMAPEQIQGGVITAKTDIYSLGIVLYEMLCGHVPFKASTRTAVLAQHLKEIPTPLRQVRRAVPLPLEQAVTRMLEKKAENRQKNMEEVVEALKS